ncbi:unnamed protein product [Larinioides sclopetarius]|uniref:AB hydrolase-1 domain-containing protein n=1 Tax=Larinioides sclopetarius TaxID=280406 RepID=A0AAV2AUR5_9ARAC
MAEYDAPSMIDLVLNVTGKKNLTYIGHSQGSTIAFALLSQKPEYNEKINMLIALAPAAFVGHTTSPIRYLIPFTANVNFLFSILGVKEILSSNIFSKYSSEILCNTKFKFICEDIIFLICGTDYSQLNATRLSVYVSHTPAGTSTKSIIHYAQMVKSKKFQKYDYGPKGNKLKYNQTSAPEYHVEKITTKTALIWSENDKLADPTDVHILEKKLKNLVSSTPVKLKEFNHLDFVWGVDANIYVYENVLSML